MMRFGKLFEVNILHDYHLNLGHIIYEVLDENLRKWIDNNYSVDDIFKIQPTPDTVKTMAGYHMLFKKSKRGFFVGMKLTELTGSIEPLVPVADDLKLRFYIKIKDSRFLNYTALPVQPSNFYFFSNTSNNEQSGQLFLTQEVEGFNSDRAYQANEIYSIESGGVFSLFRAIRDTGPSVSPVAADWDQFPVDTMDNSVTYSEGDLVLLDNSILRALVDDPGSNLSNWETVTLLPNQYVTSVDGLQLKGARFEFDISSLSLPETTVRIYRNGELSPVLENTHTAVTGNLKSIIIELSGLLAGQYRFELLDNNSVILSDEEFSFYYDQQADYEGWFGVIEIETGSGNFSLLNGSNELQTPVYNIRFLNRASRWRYIFPEDQTVGDGAEVVPEGTNNKILITEEPRPLTLFGNGALLQGDLPGPPSVNEEIVLPKPEIKRIRYQDAQWFSDIHVSNLQL